MVTMIAALVAVVGVILLIFYALRRFSGLPGTSGRRRLVTVLGSTYLGAKKNISLVEVPGAVLVLGVTADRISLLATIDDPDEIAVMRRPPEAKSATSFFRQLQESQGKDA